MSYLISQSKGKRLFIISDVLGPGEKIADGPELTDNNTLTLFQVNLVTQQVDH